LPGVTIADVSITPSGTDFASWGAYPKTVGENGMADLPIQFSPSVPGNQSATACIIIDTPCRDTICVTLEGSTADALLTADPALADFDSVAHCADQTMEIRVRNNGSTPLNLTASRIVGAEAASFRIDNPITRDEQLLPMQERALTIRVPATGVPLNGPKQAVLIVESDNSAQPELQVPLRFVRTTLVLPPTQLLDFETVFAGRAYPRPVVLRNTGTHPVRFVSVQLPDGVSVQPTTATLFPGDSLTVTVTFDHDIRGIYHDSLLFLHNGPCGGHSAIVVMADVIESLSARDLDFGIVPHCTSTDSSLFVRNLQEEDAVVTALTMTGGDVSNFSIVAPTVFPLTIPVGDSLRVDIRLTPFPGGSATYASNLRITQQGGSVTRQFDVPVAAEARMAWLSTTAPLDFGDVSIQTVSQPRSFSFVNRRPFPLRVAAVLPPPAPFTVASTVPVLPAEIGPGETLEVILRFAPETEGAFAELLTLEYEQPCRITNGYPMGGNGIDDWRVSTLRIGAHEGRVDDVVDIPIELLTDLGGLGVDGWEGTVRFDRSMLYPVEILTDGTLSDALRAELQYDGSTGALSLSATGGRLSAGTGTLAVLRFRVLVGSAMQTDLVIEPGFRFTGGLARVESTASGSFTLIDYCDVDGTRLLESDVEMTVRSNTPNPFTTRTEIQYAVSADGRLRMTVIDQQGRARAVVLDDFVRAGNHRVTIDGSRLAPGVYFLLLEGHGRSVVRKLLRMK
ncbi:MAG: choice-of-anchor D domain-containing protein, partial [Bacteroidota bacterium]|nr:choice-of-anchor D domain-containing protein [Bacteroidota bacterium]